MTKVYLKFSLGFILTHCLSLGHTSNCINYEYHEIYPQVTKTRKRILDDQDTVRVTKKLKTEVTQVLNFEREPENTNIEYIASSSLPSNKHLSSVIDDLLRRKDDIKITNLGNDAVCKIFLGQYEEALQDCNSILAILGISNNEKALTLIRCSFIEINLNEFTAAIRNYDQVLMIPKIDKARKALALINRGYVKSGLGQTKDAISDLEEALKFENVFSHQQLSIFYRKLDLLYKIHFEE